MHNLLLYKTALLRSLISLLEDEGIVVTTAAAVDMEKILAKTHLTNAEDISGIKYLIAPLLCRNKEDQDKLYSVFDKLNKKIPEVYIPGMPKPATPVEPLIIPTPNKRPLKWYLKNLVLPALFILGLFAALFFLLKYINKPASSLPVKHKINIITEQQAVLNDTVEFSAVTDSSFQNDDVRVDWKFPDTLITNKTSVSKLIRDSIIPVKVFLIDTKGKSADSNNIIDSSTLTVIALCEPPPSVDISETDIITISSQTPGNNKKQFEPLFTNPSKDSARYKYKWFVDDSLYSNEKILTYSKAYNEVRLVVDCKGVHCSRDSLVAQVQSIPSVNVAVTGDGKLQIESTYNRTNILLSILLIIILPFVIAFIIYRFIRSYKSFTLETKEEEPGTQGPYKIEFVNQQQNIHEEEGINKLADVLRKRQVSDIYKLNLRKTIRSTVIAGGIPTLEFTPLSKPLSFLAFIDKENAGSPLVKLFEYLVEKLQREEVNIEVYSYEKEPLFLSNEKLNQEHIPLEKIAALYPDTTLFIFGNAQYFLFPLKGVVKDWVTRKLSNWPTKILLTPYTTADWDKKEKLLIDANFVVLPADLSSVTVIDKIISRQIDVAAQKKERLDGSYPSRFINFQDFDALKNYLSDKYLLQWVCSLAVYPVVDWNFTIAMGQAIEQQVLQSNEYGELVNYSNLLKVARISWMQDGIINESLRVQMLAYLNKDAEALARKTLSRQLQLIESTISKDSLVKTDFDIHTKLNRFLLDAYYTHKTSNADDAFIKKMFETHQLDEGQDIYLEKGNNTLLHDPSNKNKTVALSDYFKLKSTRQKVVSRVCALIIFAGLMVSSFVLLKNYTSYLNWNFLKPSAQNYTLNIQGNNFNNELTLDLYYEPTHSAWSSRKINLANTNFSFKADSVTLKDTLGYGLVKLSTADGRLIAQDSFKLNSNAYTINIVKIEKIPLTIYYKNEAGLAMANILSENLSLNYTVNISRADFPDTSRLSVVYYETKFIKDAEYIVTTANALFEKSLYSTALIDSTRLNDSSKTKLSVYVNGTTQCTPLAVTALPQALNEIWHGGTSNRLININLAQKVIYYSVNDTKTYGTYSINEICLKEDGVYKIITQTNQGYKLFFIKNVTNQSFDLSVCQDFVSSKAELANKDESYCDHFNTMALYYQNNISVVYLPVKGITLERQELNKFNVLKSRISGAQSKLEFAYIKNAKFITDDGISITKKIPAGNTATSVTTIDSSSNPFQRSYLRFTTTTFVNPYKADVNPYKADCSKTFYSIDETLKLASPLIVCKLDLSKINLTSLPKEIYNFKNLTELNLGTTSIPEADINALQKALPNCKITYSKQENPTTQNANEPVNNNNQLDNNSTELGLITFDEKGGLNSAGRQLVNAIGKQLAVNKQSIVKFEATYSGKQEYSIIYDGLKNITNTLRKEGATASQIQQSVTELVQQQQQLSKSPNRNITINVLGVNFPADFDSNPKKAY